MPEWNPELYLKFEKERTRPVRDLLARIEHNCPRRIIDIGCGPGNSTLEIKRRYPEAEITGLDNSPAMIDRARESPEEISWVLGDAGGDLESLGDFDIVFSNAAIQWMPDHEKLLRNLAGRLRSGGVLAVQVPKFEDMRVRGIIREVSYSQKWKQYFNDFNDGMHYYKVEFYYDLLSSLSREITMWVTEYCHVMEDHGSIIDWIMSTGLRPYLDRVPESRQGEFVEEILGLIKNSYQKRADGRVIFPFRRLFFIASI